MEEFASLAETGSNKDHAGRYDGPGACGSHPEKLRKPLLDQFLATRNPAENKSTNFSENA
ncbi:MAG: hypothetical protein ACLR2E_04505 [Lachnospiraceae bacterium]